MASSERLPLGVTGVMLPELDFDEQLALCARLGVTHYVFRPRYIPEGKRDQPYHSHGNHKFDLTPERLRDEGQRLGQQVRDAGLVPFGTVPALTSDADPETIELALEGAAAAGCGNVRLAPQPYPRQQLFDYNAFNGTLLEQYGRATELARSFGIKLVIEMHAGNVAITPGLAWQIVRHFDPRELGVIIDLPNFAREGAVNPWLCISVLADWVDHCHFGGNRRVQGEYDEHGFRQGGAMMCPLTESDISIPEWVRALAALEREVPLIVEDFTANMSGATRLEIDAQAGHRLLQGLSLE